MVFRDRASLMYFTAIRGRVCQNDSSVRAKFTTRLPPRPVLCPPTLFICGRRTRTAAWHMPIFPRKKVQIKHSTCAPLDGCVCAKLLARRFYKQMARRHAKRRSRPTFSAWAEKNVFAQFVTLQFQVSNNKVNGSLSRLMESSGDQCSVASSATE